ncbi:hypothetical protein ACOZ4N_11425 [Halorientalis pallida]|uniref:hypothetical protein n=1 Tax=Halorientalis pallida TaxID=2479928 RepID=UPI003C70589E
MESRSRSVAVVGAVAVLLVLAGCSGVPGDATPTPDASGYHEPASEYLLTAAEFTNWEGNGTRAPGATPAGMESGRVLELRNGSSNLQIALLVFESPADARAFLAAQRETYREDGINATNVSVGDRAFGVTSLTETAVNAQQANVYVQVTGTVPLNASEQYARAQLRAVTDR